jgi:demethylmenaquinone methyltransferase/2-methoxy-6-polyprenyl-1,4-benzoquinol methylase
MASLEFAVPARQPLRALWWLYTRTILPATGYLAGGREWFAVGRFLGPNITEHYRQYPVDWTVEAWAKAGMVDVTVRRMSLGGGLVMSGKKAGD